MSRDGKAAEAQRTGYPGDRSKQRIAVLLPCLNEAAAIGHVVEEFRNALPDADIFVYDNASTDDTAAVAAKAGAIVRNEPARGKGYVVRRMFADIDADIYLMADGDTVKSDRCKYDQEL